MLVRFGEGNWTRERVASCSRQLKDIMFAAHNHKLTKLVMYCPNEGNVLSHDSPFVIPFANPKRQMILSSNLQLI